MGSQPLEPLEGELRTHLGQCSPEQGRPPHSEEGFLSRQDWPGWGRAEWAT